MAIFRLSAQIITRGKGQSAVSAAAYRSRSKIQDGVTQEWQDYSSKAGDLMFAGIYAPKNVPAWAQDRAQLWNEVERNENRKNSQLAREIQLALPHELTDVQQRYAVQDFVRDNFVKKGLIADVAIHRPHAHGDDRNVHAHILVTLRQVDATGWARHKQRDGKRDELEVWRDQWARTANRHLQRHGHGARIDHRSLEDQGVDRAAQIHLGKTASSMEREGIHSDRGDALREIAAANAEQRRRQLVQVNDAESAKEKEQAERDAAGRRTRRPGNVAAARDAAGAIHRLRQTMGVSLEQVVVAEDRSRADKSWQQILAQGEREARLSGRPQEPERPAGESMVQRLQRERLNRAQELRDLLPRGKAGQGRDLEQE